MDIQLSKKVTALDSDRKPSSVNFLKEKVSVKAQPHKVNHLYETPFSDVVTDEYVRGYN